MARSGFAGRSTLAVAAAVAAVAAVAVTPAVAQSQASLGKPIHVGHNPCAIAITPNGRTVYVVNSWDNTVTPIRIR
jgi:DNA-binding beta-propeller fold protein YncE